MKPGHRSQEQNQRLGAAMRKLGWSRPNEGGMVRIEGKLVMAYVRGPKPWECIKVFRNKDYGLTVSRKKDEQDGAENKGGAASPRYDDSEDIPF